MIRLHPLRYSEKDRRSEAEMALEAMASKAQEVWLVFFFRGCQGMVLWKSVGIKSREGRVGVGVGRALAGDANNAGPELRSCTLV